MKILYTALFLSISLCMSCRREGYETAHAHIVERRDLGNGKVRLSYMFKAGQTTIAGVKVIDNAVVVFSDSCMVEYKASNPLENNLKLP